MNNPQVARIFEGIAGLLEMKGEQRFTVVAYQRVARTIDQLPTELDQMLRDGQRLPERIVRGMLIVMMAPLVLLILPFAALAHLPGRH